MTLTLDLDPVYQWWILVQGYIDNNPELTVMWVILTWYLLAYIYVRFFYIAEGEDLSGVTKSVDRFMTWIFTPFIVPAICIRHCCKFFFESRSDTP